MLLCIFDILFFKQKTAYEMRISDWSSDVCSSDLGDIVSMQRGTAQVTLDNAVVQYAVRIAAATRKWPGIALGAGPRGSLALVREIGRASCRERVCQYV